MQRYRVVLYAVLPSVLVLLAVAAPCSAFDVIIVAPSGGPVIVDPWEEILFEAIARDDFGEDLTDETECTWDFGGISSIDPRGALGQNLRPAVYGQ